MATDSILIAGRLQDVRRTIADAAHAAGRNPDGITLVGVTKFFPADVARDAVRCGLMDLGENRVQELLLKGEELNEQGFTPNWHLIGTLQKNKVRHVIGITHLIHSIDSVELLEEVNRRSLAASCLSDILIQVNTAGEASKHGFDPDELPSVAEKALALPGVRLRGLMTMAPLVLDADETLPVFETTRYWFDRLAETIVLDESFDILSMGMSHDYVQAIRCGTTMVRIGSAIFGPRPPQPDVPA